MCGDISAPEQAVVKDFHLGLLAAAWTARMSATKTLRP